jgi:hypothetical protein
MAGISENTLIERSAKTMAAILANLDLSTTTETAQTLH